MRDAGGLANTDRELWREHEGNPYAASLHVTEGGGIGINVGGTVIVKTLREWHHLASEGETLAASIKWYVDYANSKDAAVCEEMGRANSAESEVSRLRGKVEEEREACAQIADRQAKHKPGVIGNTDEDITHRHCAMDIAAAIRTRASLNPEKETTE